MALMTRKSKLKDEKKKDSKHKIKIAKTVLEIVPIIGLDEKAQAYIGKGGIYIDFMQIQAKDLANESIETINYDIAVFTKLYNTYANDFKIIVTNFPTDTGRQQKYYEKLIERTRNPVFKKELQYKLNELKYIEQHRTDREYYLMFFSKDAKEHKDNKDTLEALLSNLLLEIDQEKKEKILFKLCNKNITSF